MSNPILTPELRAVFETFPESRTTDIVNAVGPFDDGAPPANGLADFELDGRDDGSLIECAPRSNTTGTTPPLVIDLGNIPVTVDAWLKRDLPPPDCIMGTWLTTTSRMLISAATGLGKTNFVMALVAHVAEGKDFLHWRALRPARVLYIDGEMSRRLLKERAEDVARRIGHSPANMCLLSHEDVRFPPLNSPAGLPFIKALVAALGPFDLIAFDNIMSLTLGDQKDPLVWQQTMPIVEWLTKEAIAQLWVHHAGQDATKSYGDKSREWRLDTCAHLTEVKRPDTDVSFELKFVKARERRPDNRAEFQDVTIALVDDEWTCSAATIPRAELKR